MTTPNQPTLVTYIVTARTPRGFIDVEVPTIGGPEAAARRARMTLVTARYGDFDDVDIFSIAEGTFPEPR